MRPTPATVDRIIELAAMLGNLRADVQRLQKLRDDSVLNDRGNVLVYRDQVRAEAQIEAGIDGIIAVLKADLKKPRDALIELVDGLEEMGIANDGGLPLPGCVIEGTEGMNGGDTVEFMCKIYPKLKEALL